MSISCIVIEDEPASQEVIEKYISDCPVLNLRGIFGNPIAAQEFLQKQPVDLMFLDINMPRLSGLQFYRSLPLPPKVIFTTAYPEYAVEGFEVNAVDYLLKPFSFERFLKAVNKLSGFLKSEENTESNKTIFLYADKKIHQVKIDDILYIEAKGDYLKVVLSQKNMLIHETLQGFLDQLPPEKFIRIHKSYAVSLGKIDYLEGNMVKIKDLTLPIGQAHKQELMKLINSKKFG